jgi:hypothetical protein
MAAAWGQKKDIYRLLNDLKFKASQEFTDDIWGRWAFVVSLPLVYYPSLLIRNLQQLKLVDFNELVKDNKQQDKSFWDWLDNELERRREKYKDEQNEETRKRKISQSVFLISFSTLSD